MTGIHKLFTTGFKILLVVLLMSFKAQAGVINSTLDQTPEDPDIASSFINTTYVGDADSGTLTASGLAVRLTNLGVGSSITDGSFNITADIMANAGTASGSLEIGGTIASLGFNSGNLLTGTLAMIGGPSMNLNFLFEITGGDAAVLYGGIGAFAGVIMSGSGFDGVSSFTGDFSGAFATADTFAVPLPGTIGLMLIGLIALGTRKKLTNK
ncbi:hypothetical protein [Thalassotalea aquiviva]|uniref:hypothetical protein n=1 Tax=Thalassotalea aquiviva TaxID=3242415 RepID=UPI00352A327F